MRRGTSKNLQRTSDDGSNALHQSAQDRRTPTFNTLGALSLEKLSDGVLHTLAEVLAADKSTPTSLVLACRGDAESGALQFSDTEWTAHIVDAEKLVAAVAEARD